MASVDTTTSSKTEHAVESTPATSEDPETFVYLTGLKVIIAFALSFSSCFSWLQTRLSLRRPSQKSPIASKASATSAGTAWYGAWLLCPSLRLEVKKILKAYFSMTTSLQPTFGRIYKTCFSTSHRWVVDGPHPDRRDVFGCHCYLRTGFSHM